MGQSNCCEKDGTKSQAVLEESDKVEADTEPETVNPMVDAKPPVYEAQVVPEEEGGANPKSDSKAPRQEEPPAMEEKEVRESALYAPTETEVQVEVVKDEEEAEEEAKSPRDTPDASERHASIVSSGSAAGPRMSTMSSMSSSMQDAGKAMRKMEKRVTNMTAGDFDSLTLETMDNIKNRGAQVDLDICLRMLGVVRRRTTASPESSGKSDQSISQTNSAVGTNVSAQSTSRGCKSVVSEASRGRFSQALTWRRSFVVFGRLLLPPLPCILSWCLWPMNDPLVDSSYWWQILVLPFPIGNFIANMFSQNSIIGMLTYQFEVVKIPNLLMSWLASQATATGVWAIGILIWTKAAGLEPPLPWAGLWCGVLGSFVTDELTKLAFPPAVRCEEFKKRVEKFSAAGALLVLSLFVFYALVIGFVHTGDYSVEINGYAIPWAQLCLVPVWIGCREGFVWALTKVCDGICGDSIGIELCVQSTFNNQQGLLLATVVGSYCEDLTEYVLVAFDIMANILTMWKALQKFTSDEEEMKSRGIRAMLVVTLAETREVIVTLYFLIGWIPLWYGPNADLVGLVKNQAWHYEQSPPILDVLDNMKILVIADLILLIITISVLKLKFKIDFFQLWLFIENRIGFTMCLSAAMFQCMFFNMQSVYSACDMTFKNDWRHGYEGYPCPKPWPCPADDDRRLFQSVAQIVAANASAIYNMTVP